MTFVVRAALLFLALGLVAKVGVPILIAMRLASMTSDPTVQAARELGEAGAAAPAGFSVVADTARFTASNDPMQDQRAIDNIVAEHCEELLRFNAATCSLQAKRTVLKVASSGREDAGDTLLLMNLLVTFKP